MEFLPDFGNLLYTVAAFVVALTIIVFVHEYGHYIVARWSGIRAEVFSIGFGPVLARRRDRHGTQWQVAAIPLGGYVKFLGDANAASAAADDAQMARLDAAERRQTLHGAPLWARAATVAAGPVFNFILSIAIFAGVFLWTGMPTERVVVGEMVELPGGGGLAPGDEIVALEGMPVADYAGLQAAVDAAGSQPTMAYTVRRGGAELTVEGPPAFPARFSGVAAGSAAMAAGLQPGDVVVAIDGAPVHVFADLQAAVAAAGEVPITLSIWRPGMAPGESRDFELTPRRTDMPRPEGGFETRYLVGATGGFAFAPELRPTGIGEALSAAATTTWGVITSSISGLWHMASGQISSCNLGGAITIAETSAAAASGGGESFIWFIAILSTAVGFLNLLPIPVLDGGHLMFHAWEALTGRPPSDGVMNLMMTVGLVLVVSLMVFGLSNDLLCP